MSVVALKVCPLWMFVTSTWAPATAVFCGSVTVPSSVLVVATWGKAQAAPRARNATRISSERSIRGSVFMNDLGYCTLTSILHSDLPIDMSYRNWLRPRQLLDHDARFGAEPGFCPARRRPARSAS